MKTQKILSIVILSILLVGLYGSAQASLLKLTTGGVDFTGAFDVTTLGGGDLVLDVEVTGLGTDSLTSYSFDVGYDDAELSFVSFSATAPSPLMADLFGPIDSSTSGVIKDINAGAFAGGTNGNAFTLGTLTFTPGTAVNDGLSDVWFNFRPGQAISGTTITTLNGADVVAAVPEPGSLLLIGSGLIGLVGFARKRG